MLALNVTPKKVIILFLIFLFKILLILSNKILDLFSFDLITDFITDKFVLNLSAVVIMAFVSLGKQDPP